MCSQGWNGRFQGRLGSLRTAVLREASRRRGGRGSWMGGLCQVGVAACPPCLLPTPRHSYPAVASRECQSSVRTALLVRTSQACASFRSGKFGSGSFLRRLAQLSAAWACSSAHPGLAALWGQSQMPWGCLALEWPPPQDLAFNPAQFRHLLLQGAFSEPHGLA